MAEQPFRGQVALITGSSRGIGRATALLLARRGADIAVHYRRDEEAALAVCSEARAAGVRAIAVQADLRDQEAVAAAVARVGAEFGRLDLLIGNAASTAFKPLLDLAPHNVGMTLDTSVQSLLTLVRSAVPLMQGRTGNIVTVSGFDTVRCLPGHGLLGAAKAAVETLTRYLATELAPLGINANCVVPGFVATDSARLWADKHEPGGYAAAAAEWVKRTPRGRVGDADDIARVIAMLCSTDARWITGQVIVADGGLTLR
ncbi:MAG: SDR family oxidoreductase [Immundisolibacter sp.]|uniref:SDR family oxidoreductase n=1 Tax=Immundisolibacter sp. TaxID=1934948 RepID=UPI003EE40DCB